MSWLLLQSPFMAERFAGIFLKINLIVEANLISIKDPVYFHLQFSAKKKVKKNQVGLSHFQAKQILISCDETQYCT